MSEVLVGQVARDAPYLSPGDSVARAISLMHRHALPGLVVLQPGQPAAVLLESDVLHHPSAPEAESDWAALRQKRVADLSLHAAPAVRRDLPLADAARLLRDSRLPCLPVLTSAGYYAGLVCSRDAVAGLVRLASPGPLAGMATPLGVYLTNGVVRAGAHGDLGLALTGAAMVLMWAVAASLVLALAWAGQRLTGFPLLALHGGFSALSNRMYVSNWEIWSGIFIVAQLAIFFALMRLSPLAATHGAEHQVVHAIEAGEELTPEAVAAHTTVYPRCGTNLVAMLLVILLGVTYVSSSARADIESLIAGVALVTIVALVLRRRVGGVLQAVLTTRRPSLERTNAAIAVGNEILQRCRVQDARAASPWRRLWYMGFVQIATGAGVTMAMLALLQRLAGVKVLPY